MTGSLRNRTWLRRLRVTPASARPRALITTARLRTCWCGGQALLPAGHGLAQKRPKSTSCTLGVTLNSVTVRLPVSVSACQLPAPSCSSIAPPRSLKPNCSLLSTLLFSAASRE